MPTLKNVEVRPAQEAIAELIKERLPIDTAIALRKLARELDAQAKIIEDVRLDLVNRHGTTDAEGKTEVVQGGPNWAAFVADFTELMSRTIDIEQTISRDMLTMRDKNGERIPIEPTGLVVFGLGDLLVDAPESHTLPLKRKRRA